MRRFLCPLSLMKSVISVLKGRVAVGGAGCRHEVPPCLSSSGGRGAKLV